MQYCMAYSTAEWHGGGTWSDVMWFGVFSMIWWRSEYEVHRWTETILTCLGKSMWPRATSRNEHRPSIQPFSSLSPLSPAPPLHAALIPPTGLPIDDFLFLRLTGFTHPHTLLPVRTFPLPPSCPLNPWDRDWEGEWGVARSTPLLLSPCLQRDKTSRMSSESVGSRVPNVWRMSLKLNAVDSLKLVAI